MEGLSILWFADGRIEQVELIGKDGSDTNSTNSSSNPHLGHLVIFEAKLIAEGSLSTSNGSKLIIYQGQAFPLCSILRLV